MKILVFLILLGFGILFIAKTDGVVGMTGRIGWAERHLGGAGTYTFYKLLGLACLIIGFMLITGIFDRMFGGALGFLFGGIRQSP
ncbi:hypothetical protein EXS54_02515 [Patescibacteria group bacterium]|nr:hypothetical protein [Patescibacteria group bacterium]